MRSIYLLLAAMALLPAITFAQTVYKSIGPDGKTIYTDRPSEDSAPVRLHVSKAQSQLTMKSSIGTTSGTADNGNLKGLTMFVTPTCSFCKSARKYMSEKHIAFSEVDITTKEGGEIARQLKIGSAVPVFIYKDKRVLGFTPAKLETLLKG